MFPVIQQKLEQYMTLPIIWLLLSVGSGLFTVLGTVSGTTVVLVLLLKLNLFILPGFPAYDSTNDKVVVAYGDSAVLIVAQQLFLLLLEYLFSVGSLTNFYTVGGGGGDSPNVAYDPVNDKVVVVHGGFQLVSICYCWNSKGRYRLVSLPIQIVSHITYYNQIVYDTNTDDL